MSNNNKNTVIKSAIIKNPVLFEAVGIAPVVAMATSLKTGIMLTAITFVQMLIIELVACKFLKMLKSRFRVLVYAVLGVIINVPMFALFDYFAPNETANVSIFLPIIAVNSLIALHCERFAVRHSIKDTLIDALASSFGYGLIVMLAGFIRELFGSGTIYSHDIGFQIRFSGLLLPFGGFLVLGYMSALLKRLIKKSYPDENPEAAFNLSEISQSHFGSIKSLFSEDYNPFSEEADADADAEDPIKLFNIKLPEKAEAQVEKTPKAHKVKKPVLKVPKREKAVKQIEIVNGEASYESKFESLEDIKKDSAPIEQNIVSDSKKYESEFDDLLNELELHKSRTKNMQEKDGGEE